MIARLVPNIRRVNAVLSISFVIVVSIVKVFGKVMEEKPVGRPVGTKILFFCLGIVKIIRKAVQ